MRIVPSPISLLPLAALAAMWLGGCIVGGDSGVRADEDAGVPALLMDLFWDELPEAGSFFGGTCQSAGVATMDWRLVNPKGTVVDQGSQPCSERLPLYRLDPAEYSLEVEGQDASGQSLWQTTCAGLLLVRFDSTYLCDVPSP